MAMSDTDIISVARLIRLVRERPVLWDRQQDVYKNRKLTRKAWTEICEALVDEYSRLSGQEQCDVGRSVIGKWANLRDNWLRYWRKRQALLSVGLSTKSLKKYIHHDQLLFLSKVYDPEIQPEVEEIQVDVDIISDPEMVSPLGISSNENLHSLWDTATDQDQLETNQPELSQPECQLYFFNSVMPLIHDFDNDQMLDFQRAVLECIRNIKYHTNCTNSALHWHPPPASPMFPTQDVIKHEEHESNTTSTSKHMFNTSLYQKYTSNQFPAEVKSSDLQVPSRVTGNLENNMVDDKVDRKLNLLLKSTEGKYINTDCEFQSLKNVVNKLENISERFSASLEDSYDQFGKYIGSLLREFSYKKLHSLKRKIVKAVLREKFSQERDCLKNNKANESMDINDSKTRKFPNSFQKERLDSETVDESSHFSTMRQDNAMTLASTLRESQQNLCSGLCSSSVLPAGVKEMPPATILLGHPPHRASILLLRHINTSDTSSPTLENKRCCVPFTKLNQTRTAELM